MSTAQQFWYVIKQEDETCQVTQFERQQTKTPEQEQWGSYSSQQEAISKKVGLILLFDQKAYLFNGLRFS
jgi:hypothetical protein